MVIGIDGDVGDVEGIGGRARLSRVDWTISWSAGIFSLAIFGLRVVLGDAGGGMAGGSAITNGIVYQVAELCFSFTQKHIFHELNVAVGIDS